MPFGETGQSLQIEQEPLRFWQRNSFKGWRVLPLDEIGAMKALVIDTEYRLLTLWMKKALIGVALTAVGRP